MTSLVWVSLLPWMMFLRMLVKLIVLGELWQQSLKDDDRVMAERFAEHEFALDNLWEQI